MNQKYLDNFLADIKNIREYIKHIELVNNIVAKNKSTDEESVQLFNEHFKIFRTEKKIFEYKAIVISLYGILERHIELWIKEHLDELPKWIPAYNLLPDKLKESNFELSIKLISIISENRYVKFDHLEKEDVLTNLNSCISEALDFKINSDAFVILSGNLKHPKIVELFKPLDIALEKMLQDNDEFSGYLINKFGENMANISSNILYEKINDLVIRRNDISHGSSIDELLDISSFEEYIEFLENYGKAIFNILIAKEIEYESKHLSFQINEIKGIFHQGSILAFALENYEIKKGDYVIVRTLKNTFSKKEILDIQINSESYIELEVKEKTDVAVNLGFGIMSSQKFYLKKKLIPVETDKVQENKEINNTKPDNEAKRSIMKHIKDFLLAIRDRVYD